MEWEKYEKQFLKKNLRLVTTLIAPIFLGIANVGK
jgi:hypothetical protein